MTRIVLCLWLLLFGTALSAADKSELQLLLAERYQADVPVAEYWVSEKLDGVRAYWDGQQLYSRNGNPYPAPVWFTASFPTSPLDGELWAGRGRFADVVSTVRKHRPRDAEWRQLRYMVFELPAGQGDFTERLRRLETVVQAADTPYLALVPQYRLPDPQALEEKLDEVVAGGGEGLMLHRADAAYTTGRSDALLKVKTYQDAEARVIAHLPGKGRNAGRLGALLVERADGVRFRLGSGFSDAERESPPLLGARVTYKYYGVTAKGLPRFASFLRVREEM